jgi:predicted ester cyclase
VIENLVRAFYARMWNAWDDAAVDEILAEDFTFRGSLGVEVRGRDGWRGYRDRIRAGVPDFHNEIVDLVVDGDRAAARLEYSGHHRGVLLDVPGSGGPIRYAGAAFFRAEADRLVSAWVLGDLDTLRGQLDQRVS